MAYHQFSPMRKQATFRLTPEALAHLKEMAATHGISQAAILELMIRDNAKQAKKGEK